MNKTLKNIYIIGAIILILFLIFIYVRFVIGGPEDDWICVDLPAQTGGEWVKHGAPSAPKPDSPCLLEKEKTGTSIDCALYSEADCPSQCVVCPPCAACSSISCQSEEFCQSIGFDRTWYESIKKKITNRGETDLIRLNTPRPNQIIESPLIIKGEARGFWFFEGDFPIVLTDWDGLIIAEGYASAICDWMTEDFVEFKAELTFTRPDTKVNSKGILILKKDNPSGLPEYDDALEIPVFF